MSIAMWNQGGAPSLFECSSPHADKANVTIGPVFCLQQNLGELSTDLLLPFLTRWWVCLLAATGLCWQFHLRRFRLRRIRSLGKAIVILNLYYAGWAGATEINSSPNAFCLSVVYLFFEEVITPFIWKRWLLPLRRREQDDGSPGGQSSALLGRRRDDDNVVHNVYMDFRKSLATAVWMFAAQVGLIVYFSVELNGGSDEDDSPGRDAHIIERFSVVKWFTAVAIISNTGAAQNGAPFQYGFWRNQWRKVDEHRFCASAAEAGFTEDSICCRCWRGASPKRHVAIRCFLDFIVNQCGRSVIRGTAPMMLAVEGPLDFVKDATAVFFVIALDDIRGMDLNDPGPWREGASGGADEIESHGNPNYTIDGLRRLLFPASFENEGRRDEGVPLEALGLEGQIE